MVHASELKETWQLEITPAACEACGWGFLAPTSQVPGQCPRCFSDTLTIVPDPGPLVSYSPELVTPFSMTSQALERATAAFAGDIPYPPLDLTPAKLAGRMKRLYLPFWMVDINVNAEWQIDVGFNYEVLSYREQYVSGRWQTQQVSETRIRWEPRLGRLNREYLNIAAPALEDASKITAAVGDLLTKNVEAYQPGFATNTYIRIPDRSPRDAWGNATPLIQKMAAEDVKKAAGSDHVRQFAWKPQFTSQNWTHLLVPIYTSYYQDDEGRPQPVLLNGRTGQIAGKRLASMTRARRSAGIVLAIAAVIFALGLFVGLLSLVVPGLLIIAGLLTPLAVLVGVFAVVPVARVWYFNKQHPA